MSPLPASRKKPFRIDLADTEKPDKKAHDKVQHGKYERLHHPAKKSKFTAFRQEYPVDVGFQNEQEEEQRHLEECCDAAGQAGSAHKAVPRPEHISFLLIFHQRAPQLIEQIAALNGFRL